MLQLLGDEVPQTPYRGFAPGPHWGTSSRRPLWPPFYISKYATVRQDNMRPALLVCGDSAQHLSCLFINVRRKFLTEIKSLSLNLANCYRAFRNILSCFNMASRAGQLSYVDPSRKPLRNFLNIYVGCFCLRAILR
jgi:hypothetical protein